MTFWEAGIRIWPLSMNPLLMFPSSSDFLIFKGGMSSSNEQCKIQNLHYCLWLCVFSGLAGSVIYLFFAMLLIQFVLFCCCCIVLCVTAKCTLIYIIDFLLILFVHLMNLSYFVCKPQFPTFSCLVLCEQQSKTHKYLL